MRKAAIPRSLKNQVWIAHVGKTFEAKCAVRWCTAIVTPFTFEAGHNVPESRGGPTTVANLRPICAQCNKSMGNRFSIDEFADLHAPPPGKRARAGGFCCLAPHGDPMEED